MNKKNTTIRIKKHANNYSKIEEAVLKINKHLDTFKRTCDARYHDTFPVENIKQIIEGCETIKNMADDIMVNKEYIEEVLETRDVYSYFKKQAEAIKEEESKLNAKKECLKIFNKMIEDAIDDEFV